MRHPQQKKVIDPKAFITSAGNRKKPVYSPRYDGKRLTLVQSGEIDIQDEINSHALETDINYILTKLGQGDLSVINPHSPIYADFKELPTNFRDVLDIALNAERIFNTLPLDVRQQFNNDYRMFVADAGTEKWYEIMGANAAPAPDQAQASDPEA